MQSETEGSACVDDKRPRLRLVIASEVRFVRESLGQLLACDGRLSVVGYAPEARQALHLCRDLRPRIALIDAALREGAKVVRQLRDEGCGVKIVVFAVAENVESVLDWVEAGIVGYIPSDAALDDLVGLLNDILEGRQACSSAVSAGLLRRLGASAPRSAPDSKGSTLTPRELEIVELIGTGLSNKEIARRLNIGLSTTKSHVHSLLNKLSLQRRGQAANWSRLQDR
jgi:two-component system nitrate/nitrite response regulator NarL